MNYVDKRRKPFFGGKPLLLSMNYVDTRTKPLFRGNPFLLSVNYVLSLKPGGTPFFGGNPFLLSVNYAETMRKPFSKGIPFMLTVYYVETRNSKPLFPGGEGGFPSCFEKAEAIRRFYPTPPGRNETDRPLISQ